MIILSINSGSSSLKFMLYNYNTKETLTTGIVERVGLDSSFIEFSCATGKYKIEHNCHCHEVAIQLMMKTMLNPEYGILTSMEQIKAFCNRAIWMAGGKIMLQGDVDQVIEAYRQNTLLHPGNPELALTEP